MIDISKWEAAQRLFPVDKTDSVVIEGGNHGFFAAYDGSERAKVLVNQPKDGIATISRRRQMNMAVETIRKVVLAVADASDGSKT